MKAIAELMELKIHGVKFAVNEEEKVEGVAKAKAEGIDQRRETKRPTKVLHVRCNDGLPWRRKRNAKHGELYPYTRCYY